MDLPCPTPNSFLPKPLDIPLDTFWWSQGGQKSGEYHFRPFSAILCSKIGFLAFSHESTVYYDQLQKTLTPQFDNLHHLVHWQGSRRRSEHFLPLTGSIYVVKNRFFEKIINQKVLGSSRTINNESFQLSRPTYIPNLSSIAPKLTELFKNSIFYLVKNFWSNHLKSTGGASGGSTPNFSPFGGTHTRFAHKCKCGLIKGSPSFVRWC